MAISFSKALGLHEQALQVRTHRGAVLANNLANADTPGFKARDIDFKAVLRGQSALSAVATPMTLSNKKHFAGQSLSSDNHHLYRIPQQPSIDGNTVEEQVEHAAYMENSLAFQASFTLLNSKFKGLMNAIRGE
ncbi:MAG: flagellar basal body rod protein FlgB [Cellvibrionaceae bacterium]|nr:flagellar basal body rod protein FlgB [Cellvibrionaceae bacterium]